jgi:hypothetical protein
MFQLGRRPWSKRGSMLPEHNETMRTQEQQAES